MPVSGRKQIESILTRAGEGARGIVFVKFKGKEVGHVFNAVNKKGKVNFPDFQSNRGGSFRNVESVQFIRTN